MARKAVEVITTELDLSSMSVDEKIVALWGQGWSMDQIGTQVGLAKGSVSYRIQRGRTAGLHLPARVPPPQRPGNRKEGSKPAPAPSPGRPSFLPETVLLGHLDALDELPFRAANINRDRYRTCQYIIGQLKCGDPIEGRSSYCAEHKAICFVPAKPKADRASYAPDTVPAARFGSMGDYK